MDTAKLSTLQNKVDELPFSPLTYRWLLPFAPGQNINQQSEIFYVPLIPYCFQFSVRFLRNSIFFIDLTIYHENDSQTYRRIDRKLSCFSVKLYLIGGTNDKSTEKIFVDEMFDFNNDRRTISLEARVSDNRQWVINNQLHIFCKINQIRRYTPVD